MNQHTYDKMIEMRMPAMAEFYQNQAKVDDYLSLSFDERLELLIDAEHDYRHRNKIARLTKQAKLSESTAQLEDIHYFSDRKLNKENFLQLASNQYIKQPRNVVLTGMTGSGKSYIACALGNHACQCGFKVLYIRMPDLLAEIAMAKVQDTYLKTITKYQNCDLLIVDEFLLMPTDETAQQVLLELVERRYRHSATIFCSKFDPVGWHKRLGSGALADSILDRVLPRAKFIHIDGEKSMRSR